MDRLSRHHLIYERATYNRNRFLQNLRRMPGLIIPIPTNEIHRPLHQRFGGVPTPGRESAELFVAKIALPYEKGQPWDYTLTQAISWFDSTGSPDTADHLAAQREFIQARIEVGEAA